MDRAQIVANSKAYIEQARAMLAKSHAAGNNRLELIRNLKACLELALKEIQ